MVKSFILCKRNRFEVTFLFDFVNAHPDKDFYITQDNKRAYITSEVILCKLLKSSIFCQVTTTDDNDYTGIVIVWKSLGGNITRNYVKLLAANTTEADKLLTILNWNFPKELYVKISKDSPMLSVFKRKGFRFQGGRGKQVLLVRSAHQPRSRGNENASNSHKH